MFLRCFSIERAFKKTKCSNYNKSLWNQFASLNCSKFIFQKNHSQCMRCLRTNFVKYLLSSFDVQFSSVVFLRIIVLVFLFLFSFL